MAYWEKCSAIERRKERLSGAWVFKGTRVPVQALFENLRSGATVDQFLKWFPGVSQQQVDQVLRFEEVSLEALG